MDVTRKPWFKTAVHISGGHLTLPDVRQFFRKGKHTVLSGACERHWIDKFNEHLDYTPLLIVGQT